MDQVLAALGARQGAFIGAWNPYSRKAPLGRNRRMGRALAEFLRRLPHRSGMGWGRGWREEHVLVATDPRRAAVLGRRLQQSAMVLVARGRPARLLVLRPQPC